MIMQPEDEPDLEKMAHRVQNLFKFKSFYDYIDFSLEQRLAIIKAIIMLTDPSGSSNIVERRSRRNNSLRTMR